METKNTELREKVLNNIEKIKDEFFYEEKFRKSYYKQEAKLCEKYGKSRLYIPRNAYEQAGYIDLLTGETVPTRPGNHSTLKRALEYIQSL